jgi:hypothetical protein
VQARLILALLTAATQLPAQNYFPAGALGENAESHQFRVDWYSKHLKALGEPSLWELSQKDPTAAVYRFLWLRSFHSPIAVRLVLAPDGSAQLHARMIKLQAGYEPGRLIRDEVVALKAVAAQSFVTALESAGFWALPSVQFQRLSINGEATVMLDGAQWIIEGVRNGKYHVVDRQSPDPGEAVRAIGLLALKLGRFKIPARDVY